MSGEKNHITPQQLGHTDCSAPALINESGYFTVCCIMSFLFSTLLVFPRPQMTWELSVSRESGTKTGNRGMFVHSVVGEHLPCQEKKGKETVVLMLLEQLPTRMTKLRLKLFCPQLDTQDCWEIVWLLRHTSDVCGISTNANNRICKPTL